ncbi:MAG TPA: molybdopterin oxidoreductase family protein [Bacteroidetes bacterium]|nr:molybdopterin oxidoreductase family protein [Bacteroidota bacterium]
MEAIHYRNCNICEALCGLEIKYEGNKILSIKGDKKDPFSRGHICPKAVALQDFYCDKDRLRHPVKKTENGFVKISWEEALDIVAENIKAVQEKYGNDAVATYAGNPNAHNFGNQLFLSNFLRSLKTKNRYSASSVDQLPHHVAGKYMFGHNLLLPVPDIDRTDFLLIIGGNPLVSNGSMMTAPDIAKRLRAIQARGGKIVVVDPRKTETAKKADKHLFIKPETDALLLLAMINVLFNENKINLRHLKENIDGLDLLKENIKKYTPEKAANITGIPADKIRSLALEMAAAGSAVCYSRMGASTQSFGGMCLWLTNVFNILNGNCDREGGAMFTMPAFDAVMMNPKKGKPEWKEIQRSRVRKLPKYYGEFPVSTLADEIETEGEGQIKALITVAGNPVLSTPNGLRLEKAIQQLDFMVCIDIYVNETSRHADIILPAATGLEIPQFDIAFHNLAIRNTVKYSPPLFEKGKGLKHDWEILTALMEKINGKKHDGRTPEMILDFALQMGAYGKTGLSFDKLKENPHGIDLGPLKPCLLKRLQTNDDKIRLANEAYLNDLKRLDKMFFPEVNSGQVHNKNGYPFQLIGRRVLRQHNTWTHNSQRLTKGKNECTLLINPDDANSLEIKKGDIVSVKSRVGQVSVEAEITNEMMPGVVCLPQGFGSRKNTAMSVAASPLSVSINDLTDEMRVDELTGNAALNGVGVVVEKAES